MSPSAGTDYQIAARIERLPVDLAFEDSHSDRNGWFFDAFDALSIAYVLPVLSGLWNLKQADIGELIAVGYVGQVIGSILFGWLAERIGRVPCDLPLILFSVMSFACAFAWDPRSLEAMRFVRVSAWAAKFRSWHPISASSPRRNGVAVCAWLPDAVYDRSLVRRLGRRLRGSESGLAVDVHYRSAAGGNSVAVALAAAGITALAREPRPLGRGR
jgi:MFS family permease